MIDPAMKLGFAMLTVLLAVAAFSAVASACPRAADSAQMQNDQSTTTSAKTTTGKTTGG